MTKLPPKRMLMTLTAGDYLEGFVQADKIHVPTNQVADDEVHLVI